MQLILDRNAGCHRPEFRRIGVQALVLGFCAFTQAAPAQVQLGAAESCFDQGPGRLPAQIVASLPQPPAALSPTIARAEALAKVRTQKAPAKKLTRSPRENALNGNRPLPGAKNPGASVAVR
jgi:hypothetical protein